MVVPSIVGFIARMLVGSVLAGAGLAKITRVAEFQQAVRALEIIPTWSTFVVSRAIVLAELGVGGCLVVGISIPVVSLIAVALFLLFAAAITINLRRGRQGLKCGCFGGRGTISRQLVLRDLALASAAALPIAPRFDYPLITSAILLFALSHFQVQQRAPAASPGR